MDKRLAWWRDAKFGMFIHWGVYSLYGGIYKGYKQAKGGAEWIQNRCKIPVGEYREKAREFNPVNYDPDAWAKLAADAGMRYLIITTKHHDGFALFETKVSDWNVVDATPYGRDLIRPLVEACRKHGLKIGFYYSQANDWTNPGGTAARRLMEEGWPHPDARKIDTYTLEHRGHWDPVQETATFDEYVDGIAVPQVKELLTNYGEVSVLWWDYATEMISYEGAVKLDEVLSLQPDILTNDRLHPDFHGDTKTPEQAIPGWDSVEEGEAWETCMTMNGSWGYKSFDINWKSAKQLIINLVRIVARGGNYLLNVGPAGDGSLPKEYCERFRAIGSWLAINGEAVYGTEASPFRGVPWGECTCRVDGDKTLLYCFVLDWPDDSNLRIDGLSSRVISVEMLAGGAAPDFVQNGEGCTLMLPETPPDPVVSVARVVVEGRIVNKSPEGRTREMQTGALD